MAANVARIYEHTIRPGRSYCRICLRSANETTLVTPKSVLQFADALKLNIFDGKKHRSVCYICEAYAGTALRLYQACINAVSVKTVCEPLKNMSANDPVPEWLRKAILGCNANLKEYRQKTTMQQTEVLVVDSSGIEWHPEEGSTCNEPTRIIAPTMPLKPIDHAQQLETVVLDDDEDDAPAQEQIPQRVMPPTADTLPILVPIEKLLDPTENDKQNCATLLPEQMRIISRHDTEPNNFILHPIVFGENNKLIAPSLGGEIVNGQLIFNATLYQPMPMVDCTEMRYVVQGTNLNIAQSDTVSIPNSQSTNEPEEILPDKRQLRARSRIYGTTKYGYINKNLCAIPDASKKRTSETTECVKKQKSQYVVDLDTVNIIIANSEGPITAISNVSSNSEEPMEVISNVTSNSEEPLAVISNVISNSQEPIAVISNVISNSEEPIAVISNVISASDSELGVIKEVVSRPPRLIERNDKIDWEDKIPMDVISFVDSSDPFDRELIVPDSLPAQRQQTQQQKKWQQQLHQQQQQPTPQIQNVQPVRYEHSTDQVIDLC